MNLSCVYIKYIGSNNNSGCDFIICQVLKNAGLTHGCEKKKVVTPVTEKFFYCFPNYWIISQNENYFCPVFIQTRDHLWGKNPQFAYPVNSN